MKRNDIYSWVGLIERFCIHLSGVAWITLFIFRRILPLQRGDVLMPRAAGESNLFNFYNPHSVAHGLFTAGADEHTPHCRLFLWCDTRSRATVDKLPLRQNQDSANRLADQNRPHRADLPFEIWHNNNKNETHIYLLYKTGPSLPFYCWHRTRTRAFHNFGIIKRAFYLDATFMRLLKSDAGATFEQVPNVWNRVVCVVITYTRIVCGTLKDNIIWHMALVGRVSERMFEKWTFIKNSLACSKVRY